MHIVTIITLVFLFITLIFLCLVLFYKLRRKNEQINDPNAAYSILSHWCTNVHKGSDLERLYAEMESSIELLNQRRNS